MPWVGAACTHGQPHLQRVSHNQFLSGNLRLHWIEAGSFMNGWLHYNNIQ